MNYPILTTPNSMQLRFVFRGVAVFYSFHIYFKIAFLSGFFFA